MKALRSELTSAFLERDAKIIDANKNLIEANDRITRLQDANRKLLNDADEQDAYIRRDSVIFSGDKLPAYRSDEDCKNIIRKLIRDDLRLNIDPLISTAHRLGRPPASDIPDKRDIIVRFCQRDVKFLVLSTGRKLKVKDLFLSESLTPNRRTIQFVLRKIRRKHPTLVTGTTTHNGRIFVLTPPAPNAPPNSKNISTELNTMEALSSFCTNFVKEPLPNFLTATTR